MKFTDLNFDCLETVLEYLKLVDLLNMADSTRRLKKAAELVYARKYGDWPVIFGAMEKSPVQSFRFTNQGIESKGLKASLQLLRCVGSAISVIALDPVAIQEPNPSQMDRRLFNYINNYCAEHLEEITLQQNEDSSRYYRRPILDYFKKPFTSLVRLYHIDYNFTAKICLKTLFPNLKELKSGHMINASFYKFNTKHFPNLDTLGIQESAKRNLSCLRNDMVLAFLKLNAQLKDLRIVSTHLRSSNLNTNLIWSAVDSLPNLEDVNLSIKPVPSTKINAKHMRNVKIFRIGFKKLKEMPVNVLPFTFDQLEQFDISFPKVKFYSSFVEQFLNFIEKHPTIKDLAMWKLTNFELVNWSKLAQSLPFLVRISIFDHRFSTDKAIEFIEKFQTVKEFEFNFNDDYGSFRKRLNGKWEGKYEVEEELVVLRRIKV